MNPNALAAELEREPFRPFCIHMSDGCKFDVVNPAVAMISDLAVYLFNIRKERRSIADDTHLLSLRHIVSLEPLDQTKPQKTPKPRKR